MGEALTTWRKHLHDRGEEPVEPPMSCCHHRDERSRPSDQVHQKIVKDRERVYVRNERGAAVSRTPRRADASLLIPVPAVTSRDVTWADAGSPADTVIAS